MFVCRENPGSPQVAESAINDSCSLFVKGDRAEGRSSSIDRVQDFGVRRRVDGRLTVKLERQSILAAIRKA